METQMGGQNEAEPSLTQRSPSRGDQVGSTGQEEFKGTSPQSPWLASAPSFLAQSLDPDL